MATSVTAIVFDSSAFGGGQFDFDLTQRWADACIAHDCDLWIPEAVLWELAEHALRQDAECQDKLRFENRRRKKIGLDRLEIPEPLTFEAFRALVEGSGVVVVPMGAQEALTSLRDQLLQTGSGHTKKGIKTGAGDGGWIRSVLAKNGGTFEDLIIVSGDRDALDRVAAAEGVDEPRRVDRPWDIQDWLGDSVEATDEQVEAALASIDRSWDESELIQAIVDQGHHYVPANPLHLDEYGYWEIQGKAIDVLDKPQPDADLPITFDPWLDAMRIQLRAQFTVNELYVGYDMTGDDPIPMREVEGTLAASFYATVFGDGSAVFDFDDLEVASPEDSVEVNVVT